MLEDTLNCFQFFGFGAGYASQRVAEFMPLNAKRYCDVCRFRDACLSKHRERTRQFMPGLTQAFDQATEQGLTGHARQIYVMDRFQLPPNTECDPYQLFANANTEDGIRVGMGGMPADRGQATLVYPFRRLS